MTLVDALARQEQSRGWSAFTSLNTLTAAKNRILSRWPDVVPDPPEKDRERLVQEMRERMETNHWVDAHMSLAIAAGRRCSPGTQEPR